MSDWGRDTPPEASSGVFVSATSITIDAPPEKVWSTLLDFKSYREWNPFVRHQVLTDASRNPLPESSQEPSPGKYVYMNPVHLPPQMDKPSLPWQKNSTLVVITYLNHETRRVAWRTASFPRFLLDAERWQTVSVGDDGKTRYETYEVFRGPLAYVVNFFMGKHLHQAARAMAEGLKARAEAS
ncbi:hypothetical protein D9758_011215 [Tetrapyrgos nigripes]|uniref:Coenzyme Q-binding protein COQ10 START domain-containing protein n=1 Tax=Tetrapyrgos nigripes TaxID=182062 RepID=A0A8H5D6R3_9AGAR|nr:hypothetical protein D9758_011215 [Tetrapyrgos nigripes]